MTPAQYAAITHLRLVGRDIHRYVVLGRGYGLSEEQIRAAIQDGTDTAEREEGRHAHQIHET